MQKSLVALNIVGEVVCIHAALPKSHKQDNSSTKKKPGFYCWENRGDKHPYAPKDSGQNNQRNQIIATDVVIGIQKPRLFQFVCNGKTKEKDDQYLNQGKTYNEESNNPSDEEIEDVHKPK